MKYRKLGQSDLEVSQLCLGTMTWGTQTSEADAHRQIDTSQAAGINFMDTAEMYPTTPRTDETFGRTEEIIGTWVAANKAKRDDWIIATKIIGPSGQRDGKGITPETLIEAVEASLKRLQTDVIDLYQFHWPNRGHYHFRQNWTYDPSGQDTSGVLNNMAAVLETAQQLHSDGKVRAFGLSNETAWGTTQWIRLAAELNAPRMISIQNEYSLLCRSFDTDLAEVAHHENVDLLPFSPLAAGLLTGKYQNGAVPDGSRKSIGFELGGRASGERVWPAIDAYLEIADRFGIPPVHLALRFCLNRPFMGSAIFGATTQAQLDHILGMPVEPLPTEVMDAIDRAHRSNPQPY